MNLIRTKARSRSFVEAGVDMEGVCVVFEPDSCSLEMHGLGALESARKGADLSSELSPEGCVS